MVMVLTGVTVVAKELLKVAITVPRARLAAVVYEIMKAGCFHPIPVRVGGKGTEHLVNVRRLLTEAESLVNRIEAILGEIGVEASQSKESPSIKVWDWLKTAEAVISEAQVVVSEAEKLFRRYKELISPPPELAEIFEIVKAYSFIDFDISKFDKAKYVKLAIYRVPMEKLSIFEDLIQSIENVFGVTVVGAEPGMALALLFYLPGVESEIAKAANRVRATPFKIPSEFPQNPAAFIKGVEAEIAKLREKLEEMAPDLIRIKIKLETIIAALRILEATRITRLFAVVTGYVPIEAYEKLMRRIEEVTYGAYSFYIERRAVAVEGEASIVEAPKLLRPFANLILMYSHPRPREIFPLLLTAITFPIIYGLMFPDLGHALVLLLLAALILKGIIPFNRDIGILLTYLGISSAIFGFLAGEFFGPHPAVAGWLNEIWHGHPPYSSPLHPLVLAQFGQLDVEEAIHEVVQLVYFTLYISLSVGAILLSLASWFGVANSIMLRATFELPVALARALAFTGLMLIFVLGGSASGAARIVAGVVALDKMLGMKLTVYELLVANIARAMIVLGLILAFIAPFLRREHEESLGAKLIDGFMELFDLTLIMVGNTASFARIMGLMLAHSGLMYGFTIMSLLACSPTTCTATGAVFAAIIYVLGNLLTIGLEALVAFMHTLRLHFYEMFTKFFEGGGVPFKPVKIPENVIVVIAS